MHNELQNAFLQRLSKRSKNLEEECDQRSLHEDQGSCFPDISILACRTHKG